MDGRSSLGSLARSDIFVPEGRFDSTVGNRYSDSIATVGSSETDHRQLPPSNHGSKLTVPASRSFPKQRSATSRRSSSRFRTPASIGSIDHGRTEVERDA